MTACSPKIVFAGTPEFAVPSLQRLIDEHYSIVAVYTQPDRRAGRGRKYQLSPIKQLAQSYNIPVEQPTSLRAQEQQTQLEHYQADLMIVIAYGLLLPKPVLQQFPLGCCNIHASLLPRWRGAAPIQHALLAGDEITGISLMQITPHLDAGPVYGQKRCPIMAQETAQTLHDKLSQLGADTLSALLPKVIQKQIRPMPQKEAQATYAPKISIQQGQIDWNQPAIEIERQVRALNPWPIAFSHLHQQTVRVWQAQAHPTQSTHHHSPGTIIAATSNGIDVATGYGILRLYQLQFPSGKALMIRDILNSKANRVQPGNQFQ